MKKLFLFLVSMALVSAAMAQLTTTEYYAFSYGDTKKGIVREQGIAYYEQSGQGCFACVPPFSFTTAPVPFNAAKVPAGWHIRDFHVVNDTAYFCGIDSNTQSALLGWFGINDLVSGSGPTIVCNYDHNIGSQLSILNRIAVHKDKVKNVLSIMAIGRKDHGVDPDTNGADRVLYFYDYDSGIPGCIFRANTETYTELFWDVVVTDNFFSVPGIAFFPSKTMTLRSVPIGTNVAAFQPIFRNSKQYLCNNTFSSGIRAASLDEDKIALASYYNGALYPGIQIFTLDVSSGQMVFNQWTFFSGASPTGLCMMPRDMAYQPSTGALMVIDTSALREEYILQLDPYPTGWMYNAPYFFKYREPIHFTSLSPYASNSFLAACGANWMLLDPTILPPPSYSDGCIGSFTIDLFPSEKFEFDYLDLGETELYIGKIGMQWFYALNNDVYPCYRSQTDSLITDPFTKLHMQIKK